MPMTIVVSGIAKIFVGELVETGMQYTVKAHSHKSLRRMPLELNNWLVGDM